MNEFLPRNDAVNVAPVAAISAVQPVRVQPAAAASNDREDSATSLPRRVQTPQPVISDEAQLSSAAEFARAHQEIAALLAEMKSTESADSLANAEAALDRMIPRPTVIIPLPPATPQQMERAIEIAKAMRADAMLARAAQAHVLADSVDAVFS